MKQISTIQCTTAALAVSLLAGLSLSAAAPVFAQDEKAQDETIEAEAEADANTEAEEMTKGEKRLAKILEGRVAGEPTACIRMMPTQRMTTIDGTAYVYGSGNTIYVQYTSKPERINDRDALVTQRFGGTSQVCRQDITRTIDPVTRMITGAVFFEDFIPYTRVKDAGQDKG